MKIKLPCVSGAILSVPAFIVAVAAVFTAIPGMANPPTPKLPNDCKHPYWSDTLRCKALDLAEQGDRPQPNINDHPATVGDLRDYTRVFLGNPALRCLDGTRPLLYVAPAVCTDPGGCVQPGGRRAQPGESMISNNWIISFTGGGACHARDLDGDGVFEDGRLCTGVYLDEGSGMSSAFDPPMKNFSDGIMSRDPRDNPVFAAYNSVRIDKCSYDRYNGRSKHTNVEGSLLDNTFYYTLFNQGQRIAETAVKTLAKGLRYRTWTDSDGDGVVDKVKMHLPRLSQARQVVFVAHSGATQGLRQNIDRLAEIVTRRHHVDVRALFDENFLPSIENEAAFVSFLGGDAYTDQWTGTSSASGESIEYNGEDFHRDGLVANQIDAWNTRLDRSCLAAHSPNTRWKCRDRQHVLFNHISTPMFVREDFTDPGFEHTDDGSGHPIRWALLPGCTYPDVTFVEGCDPRFETATEHRDRLVRMAGTLLMDIGSRSEMALGIDTSLAPGQVPAVHMWMPSCGSHTGAYKDDPFHNTTIEENGVEISMHDALVSFLATPRFNTTAWQIDGTLGGRTMTSICPP